MEKSKKDLENHISDVIPYRYAQCMEGLRDVLREINNIIERTTDDKTRMAGLQLRTNIYKNIMEMTADGQVVSMAIAKVKQLQRRQQQPQSPEQEEEADIDVRPNCSNEQIEEEEDLEQDEE
jgi:hypothetical protein